MAWQMGDWRFVESGASVNIHRVDDLICRLVRIMRRYMGRLILSSWSEKQAAVRSKCQTSEE